MRIVICDDNQILGNKLADYIKEYIVSSTYYDDSLGVEYIHKSKELIPYIRSHDIDVLFLDISMPEVGGFDIAKFISDNGYQIKIIFISSFENNVFYSLRYQPFRFIRKDRLYDEITEALDSVYKELYSKYRYLTIKKHNDIIPVRIANIIYAEKDKRSNYINIYCKDDKFRYRGTISEFESLLNGCDFVKASINSFINMAHIINISNATIEMVGGYKYYITSDKYRNAVKTTYLKYMRGM